MSIKVDQALISHFIAGDFGLPIAHENSDYDPTPGTAYAEIVVLQNDVTAGPLANENDTDGVFRVLLNYQQNVGAFQAKSKADDIFNSYKIGQRITYAGTKITVISNQRQPGVQEDGWYRLNLTIGYRATLQR